MELSSRASMRFLLPLTILLGATVAGCVSPESQPSGPVRFADVHGLGVDPQNPAVVYVATHHGLFKGVNDKDWTKVGKETMDLMGFTMHPTNADVLYASGHPATGGLLGVVKSTDGGLSWATVALKNEVDFHAMTISLADPDTVWGFYYRNQRLYESTDAGATWNNFLPPTPAPPINSLASHAAEASTVMAGTNDGVWISRDGGHTWSKLEGAQPGGAAGPIATSTANPDLLWAHYSGVGMARSTDGGTTWQTADAISWGPSDGPSAIAINPNDPSIVYVASGRGAVYKSSDNGNAWTQVQQPG